MHEQDCHLNADEREIEFETEYDMDMRGLRISSDVGENAL
jgi:hypothetical protein